MEVDHIDSLLERYLHLLHEYTTLRDQLGSLQTGMYQNIARANFAAERGLRFGQDHYDERMQASRTVSITKDDDDGDDGQESSIPKFAITAEARGEAWKEAVSDGDGAGDVAGRRGGGGGEKKEAGADADADADAGVDVDVDVDIDVSPKIQRKDPLRWFGLLTPMALRQAQAQSIQAVEQVIPRLVSVNAEMAHVEIEVRRARKKRAKAEAATAKKEQQAEIGVSTEVAV
ncbi:hypothetical protein F5B19DRAFT_297619 [Rostrohypoxylon terebratum]|nr:hypothetical protein F5B19DRAFT_297619 [Rostrohypoxylon terebratum]